MLSSSQIFYLTHCSFLTDRSLCPEPSNTCKRYIIQISAAHPKTEREVLEVFQQRKRAAAGAMEEEVKAMIEDLEALKRSLPGTSHHESISKVFHQPTSSISRFSSSMQLIQAPKSISKPFPTSILFNNPLLVISTMSFGSYVEVGRKIMKSVCRSHSSGFNRFNCIDFITTKSRWDFLFCLNLGKGKEMLGSCSFFIFCSRCSCYL